MNLDHSLPRALDAAAERYPDRVVRLFDRRGRRGDDRAQPELLAAARRSARRLAGLGVREGDRVVVSLHTSWEWFDVWLGSLMLGALPVAVAPALATATGRGPVERIEGIVEQLGARLLVCDERFRSRLVESPGSRAASVAASPEQVTAAEPSRVALDADRGAEQTAFLQLTSGSTGRPRAVMISHRAVQHQAYAQDEVVGAPFGRRSRDCFTALVSWLPLYHDMGLLGIFYSLLNGRDLWLMPPQAFLARPRSWLEVAGAGGWTVSAAPNFGYQLCVERLSADEVRGLDLSGFRAALAGAEMVRPETVEGFSERFAGSGFRQDSFRPCYGLAEATLAVTMDRRGAGARTVRAPDAADVGLGLSRLVGTGPPIPGTEVRIAAPDGTTLPEGVVGEVWVAGPSIFLGYYGDPRAKAETLVDGWLRTGDLGFLDGGELFLAGRLKDLLIVRGQNMMPHEFERLAETVTGGGGSRRAAAFTVARGAQGEEVVVVVEGPVSEGAAREEMAQQIRSRIGRELGLPLADVVFVRRGRIPKTTSGKVRRAELRRRYAEGRLQRL